jgi:hypothetical protein
MKKPTVDEYVQALEKMKRNSRDRIGILGELGVTGLGLTAGFALSGTVAGAAGAATLAGSTTLASLLGGVFITTTPVGWIVGAAIAGGSLAYAAGKLVRSGGKCDTLRNLTIRELEQRIRLLRQEARLSSTHDEKMPKVITGIQYLVANFHITQEKSTELLAAIEKGQISVDDAFGLIQGFINQSST